MTQEVIRELDITEYAELVNGKVAGLRLALTLFVANTQTKEQIESYVRILEDAESLIETGMQKGDFQFDSKEYPNGTLAELRNLRESLTGLSREKGGIEDDR